MSSVPPRPCPGRQQAGLVQEPYLRRSHQATAVCLLQQGGTLHLLRGPRPPRSLGEPWPVAVLSEQQSQPSAQGHAQGGTCPPPALDLGPACGHWYLHVGVESGDACLGNLLLHAHVDFG